MFLQASVGGRNISFLDKDLFNKKFVTTRELVFSAVSTLRRIMNKELVTYSLFP